MTTTTDIESADAVAELEAELLQEPPFPALDFMRGFLAHIGPHVSGADAMTLRGWTEALIDEVQHLRNELLRMPVEPDGKTDSADDLTPAEVKVFRYLRNTGMSYREIANELYVSINTVKSHGKNVFRKLEVGSRRELRALPSA